MRSFNINTNGNQSILIMATTLVIAAGLLIIPAVDNHDANAASIR